MVNSGISSASAGTICTISSRIRNDVRNRKRNLATAVAASSANTAPITTALSATRVLLKRYCQMEGLRRPW